MAEFCYYCIQDIFPEVHPERNGLRHDGTEDAPMVCEGCGPGWFLPDGKPVTVDLNRLGIAALCGMVFFDQSGAATVELLRRIDREPVHEVKGPAMVIALDGTELAPAFIPAGKLYRGVCVSFATRQPLYYRRG
jgi:hypothetical protein